MQVSEFQVSEFRFYLIESDCATILYDCILYSFSGFDSDLIQFAFRIELQFALVHFVSLVLFYSNTHLLTAVTGFPYSLITGFPRPLGYAPHTTHGLEVRF